jgi:hypothetical protein
MAASARAEGVVSSAASRRVRERERLRVGVGGLQRVQPRGDRRAAREQLGAPVRERHVPALALQAQARLAPAGGREVLVARERGRSPPACPAGCRPAGSAAGTRRGSASVGAPMPTGSKGSRSMQRTSTYSTPRSRSACSGRSPLRMARLGRMVP